MTKVKICGITTLADARYASGAGADYLGFIQHEGSQRFVAPDMARDIINWVYGAQSVGVFVDKDAEKVNEICDLTGFEFVQLHGSESPSYCQWIDRPIIKALRIEPGTTAQSLQEEMEAFAEVAEFFLLDTALATIPAASGPPFGGVGSFGGLGISFDWSILRSLKSPLPFFLAGGLHAENVLEAIRIASPYCVDVSSGVEESPGIKDFLKLDAFMTQLGSGVEK
jgi:phosphoribosylanthranilate isomerase